MFTTSAPPCSAPAAARAPRRPEERAALAVEEDRRAQVGRELEVDLLRRQVPDRLADADAGVVDEDVEPPVALAVGGDHALDVLLQPEVARDGLHVEALAGELPGGRLELLR